MQVELINPSDKPLEVLYTSARTCYSADTAYDLWDSALINIEKEKMRDLVLKVLRSGHRSIARHINLTFTIDGISRACANQLERHTAGFAYSQQSLRYVKIKEDYDELMALIYVDNLDNEAYKMCDKYFVNPFDIEKENHLHHCFAEYSIESLTSYLSLIKYGAKAEDARGILGLNFKTNMVVTCNLEAFIHLCELRLCKRSQLEIRTMVSKMVDEVLSLDEYKFLKEFFTAKCSTCTEERKCV